MVLTWEWRKISVPKFVENWSHAVSNVGFIQPVECDCILLALLEHADHTQVNKLNQLTLF